MSNMLGDFLREKRGDISLRDFAKKLDISHTYLDSLEKGYDNRSKKPLRVTVDTLSKIATALNEPLDKLVALSENRNPNRVHLTAMDFAFAAGIKKLNRENQEILKRIMQELLDKQKEDEAKNK